MRLTLVLVLLTAAGLSLDAQEKKKKPAPEPKVWMCKKGPLLWEERFEGGAYSKEWRKGNGAYAVDGEALKAAEVAADKHNAYMSRKVAETNIVVQFTFKLDGSPWMGVAFDGKEHIAHLTLAPDSFKISKMQGIGPTTRGTDVDTRRMKLNDGAWHTVVWEIYGDEMVATVDDKEMVLGKAEGISTERLHLELNNGGQFALYRDIKIWKAEPDPRWPQNRDRLFQLLKKKPASLGYK